MLATALALIVIGVVLLFIVPWVGIPAGVVGMLLLVGYVIGISRREHPVRQPQR